MLSVYIALVLLFLVYKCLYGIRKPLNFPPGPPRLPLIGSIPFLPKVKGPIAFEGEKITALYGKVVGLYVGPIPAVALYDYEAVKQIFGQPEALGRPNTFVFNQRMLGKRLGILFNDSPTYRTQRISAHRTLKDFGFGRKGIEETIKSESEYLVEYLKDHLDHDHDLMVILNVIVLNALWKIVGDRRYSIDDPKMRNLIELVNETNKADNLKLLLIMPLIRFIFPEKSGWNSQKRVVQQLHKLAQEMVDEHKNTFDEDNVPRDFIDVYLKQMKENPKVFNEEELLIVITDLFIAGSETTSTTLYWIIRYMLEYPEVQRKVQEELDQVLGGSAPSLDDRSKLVYTEATLMEVMRHQTVLPFGVPRRAMADIKYKDYTIPEGSIMYGVARYIMRDPSYWKNADDFDPERFIVTDPIKHQLTIKKEDHFMPFGAGKRQCLGELLAKQEVFLITAKMLQNFTFAPSDNHELPGIEGTRGMISGPQNYHTKITLRK